MKNLGLYSSILTVILTVTFGYFYNQASSQVAKDSVIIAGLEYDLADFKTQTSLLQEQVEATKSEAANLRDRLSSANSQIAVSQTQLQAATFEISNLKSQISVFDEQVSNLQTQLSSATSQLPQLKQQITLLTEKITPTQPTHNLSSTDYLVSSTYCNLAWAGRDRDLQATARTVNTAYFQWHTYIANETDCNDMACDVWDMLRKQGILSLIAIGNTHISKEQFAQFNHAWLLIFNSSGRCFALEPTNGQLYFAGDAEIDQYTECLLYAKPSDLRADLGTRW